MDSVKINAQADMILSYVKPAEQWYNGFPLANGRMGAMVFGGARAERIYLSETTFWSGEPSLTNTPPQAPEIFRQVREHLLKREIPEANTLAHALEGRKQNFGTNLPFGNLRLLFPQEELQQRDYRRALDLDTAIATVQYRLGNTLYQREMFISAPHQVLVVRLTCSEPQGLSLRVLLDGDEQPFTVCAEGADTLVMHNKAREWQHSNGEVGVSGCARLKVLAEQGSVRASDGQLIISGADAATLLLAMGTTYTGGDPNQTCQDQLAAAAEVPYADLRQAHLQEYQGWFRRASLDLGPDPHPDWTLDQRIAAVRAGADDPHLGALLFQFGRYMLIGSSRPDSPLPANLTGAWNDNKACRIGWTCDYHLDINTQMNYWIAELTNLNECHRPLFRWMEKTLVPSGRHTAQVLYGLPGWVAHIFSNAWGFSAWGWSTFWGVFPTGGVWAALHLWDHYRFTGDRTFLAEQGYPILREAAEFFLAYLVQDPQTGWLVSGPANSPENAFLYEGKAYTVALSPTVDRVLIAELFNACIQAGAVLGVDADFTARLQQAASQLPPYQIGKHGQIQEWLEDYDEAIPGHRHTSHLLGLFPFAQISPEKTPELAQAARVSIERRQSAPGYEEGAWARNNMTLFYARLADGEGAYNSLMTLFRKEADDSLLTGCRLAPANAYEMDYNTGASAAVAEMLLQSHAGAIQLLPALPAAWPQGTVRGLRARGGFEVTIHWEQGQLVEAEIVSHLGGPCRIMKAESLEVLQGIRPITASQVENDGTIEFDTQPGGHYTIRRAG